MEIWMDVGAGGTGAGIGPGQGTCRAEMPLTLDKLGAGTDFFCRKESAENAKRKGILNPDFWGPGVGN